jgi:hypothetical protein
MICAYKDCTGVKEFEPKTHNQKYCSDECCKIATNLRIKEKYERKKAKLSGEPFKCKTRGCTYILSMYSTGDYCESCKNKEKYKDRQEVLNILNGKA